MGLLWIRSRALGFRKNEFVSNKSGTDFVKYLSYVFGLVVFLAISSARAEAPVHPPPSKQPAAPVLDEVSGGDELGKFQASLAQIKASFERRNLTAAELQALRVQMDSLSDSIGAAVQRLEPRLAAT